MSFELKVISTSQEIEQSLEFLRVHFFPREPCAQNLDLCPLGYQIPALEQSIEDILSLNLSIGAFQDGDLIGIVILDSKGTEVEPNGDKICSKYPEKFQKLDRFFTDLCTNYGKLDIFERLKAQKILDIFIICTR